MKVTVRTKYRVPFIHILLILLFALGSAYYYFSHVPTVSKSSVQASLISLPPVITAPEPALDPLPITRTVEIERNSTFAELMNASGIDPATAQQIHDSARDVYNLSQIHTGRVMTIVSTPEHEFSKLEYAIDPLQTLIINNDNGTLQSKIVRRDVETKIEDLGGYIEGSLYATIGRMGEEDQLVIDFADIFEWDVDFFKDLQQGDTFRIVYEKQYVDGEEYGYGKILAAELTNRGKTYSAIGYRRGDKLEYFSPDGRPMRKAFLAAPLKFSRISSGFTKSRYHPVLKTRRPHYGIDYAAPAGTPVRAIGSGRVVLAGWAGGGGKTVKIQHDREISSAYCHLSRFATGIRAGASVSQGQVIGYVGSTGLATGPHLDFRFMKGGKYVNWLSIKTPQAAPLSPAELQKFQTASAAIIERLARVELETPPTQIASSAASRALTISEEVR